VFGLSESENNPVALCMSTFSHNADFLHILSQSAVRDPGIDSCSGQFVCLSQEATAVYSLAHLLHISTAVPRLIRLPHCGMVK